MPDAPKDAGDFFKQLGENVLTHSVPSAGLAALDAKIKSITLETRSKLLPVLHIDKPFAGAGNTGPGRSGPTMSGGGKPGALADLRPKFTAYDADGKQVFAWAPYGEPEPKSVGEPEVKAIGGTLLGLGAVFGLGWWWGRRSLRSSLKRLPKPSK